MTSPADTQPQELLISRVRTLCHNDPRVVAALMYGSATKGEADAYSDIEFVIFLDDRAVGTFDRVAWIEQVAHVQMHYVNEHGISDVIFEGLVRGEFHFDPVSTIQQVNTWGEAAGFPPPEAMLILDRTGQLLPLLEHISGPGPDRTVLERVTWEWRAFLNWHLFGASVLARGERARALEILNIAHRSLLRLARLTEGTTSHWQTPSKGLEKDLSPDAYRRFAACTANLAPGRLERAYAAAWSWAKELARALARTHGLDCLDGLLNELDERYAKWLNPKPQKTIS